MKSKLKSIFKKLIILLFGIYIINKFISQQIILDSYASNKEYYENNILKQLELKKDLLELKENINSPEYIEKIAREKLDMYLPNERVYLDIES